MKQKVKSIIEKAYQIPYTEEAFQLIPEYIVQIREYIESNHFLNAKEYQNELKEICELFEELSEYKSRQDRLLQKNIQRGLANIARKVMEENKKIFIVHGRNIGMRDKVSSLLGRLKLDYVVLESEHNEGATIIEKFLKHSEDCEYAIVLFSADDVGKLHESNEPEQFRPRQNVILELGYFLGVAGRKNIIILHETGRSIEKPSDFDGIVYEPFDEYGAWKSKLIKEMKRAKIFIDKNLEERV